MSAAAAAPEGVDPRAALFISCGLDQKLATQTVNNKKLCAVLEQLLNEAGCEKGCDKTTGSLIYTVAGKLAPESTALAKSNRGDLLKYITDKKIRNDKQVNAAIAYFKTKSVFSAEEFENECGVGVVVSTEEIKAVVGQILDVNKSVLLEQRYRGTGPVLGQLNAALKWADGKVMKDEFDAAILSLLGEKTEADLKGPVKEAKAAPVDAAAQAAAKKKQMEEDRLKRAAAVAAAAEEEKKDADDEFETPPEDFLEGRGLLWAQNTEKQLEAAKSGNGGRVITRFPPEPNGYLHIGHAKAMAQNFGVAKKFKGHCIMRFDDTNPDAEEEEYIDNILENLAFLGHKPIKVTYSSDYFDELYQLAVKLIKKDKAYVCHQTKDEMKADRDVGKKSGSVPASPYRDRPMEENLRLFEDMRKGKYNEGGAVLRMKGDLTHPNPNMWDTVFYRVKYTPHPHTKDKWCIYPTYDYTHCIIDSLEWITYSMCTLEFEIRRESYFWLLYELDLYKPKVWEYSRLNIETNVLSKRRLRALVEEKFVADWDDPRLLTINGLRRRGYTANAINNFCKAVGVSRNANFIPLDKLEFAVREDLNVSAHRGFVVVDPLKVTLTNFEEGKVLDVEVANIPVDETAGVHKVPLSRVVYIDRSDFMVNPDKNFFGLGLGKEVHLKNACNITCTKINVDAEGNVTDLEATYEISERKCKGKLHWVSSRPGEKPAAVQLNMYAQLFNSTDPMSMKEWRSDLNAQSLTVKHGLMDAFIAKAKVNEKFQFERVGYFNCDKDSTDEKKIFNLTCYLKAGKK